MSAPGSPSPYRLFLDSGVLVDGFFNRWGTCKGALILTTQRRRFRALVAASVALEVARAVASKTRRMEASEAAIARDEIDGWFAIARLDAIPWPSPSEMAAWADLLPVVRYRNDLPSVVAAVLARPDWVISTNDRHWNQTLAARTRLRIATPREFLAQLRST